MPQETMIITGGAGFIGINASKFFLKRGWRVIILDNLSRPGANSNIEWLNCSSEFELIHRDIREYSVVSSLIAKNKPSVILHLAGQVAVTKSVENPIEDFEINAAGTLNLLEAVRKHSPKTFFIYASTNKVYGHLTNLKIVECEKRYEYANQKAGIDETFPLDLYSPYGCSKGAGDQYVIDYSRIYGLATAVFRQSCIYGPRQFGHEDQGWVAWFTIAALLDKELTVYGDGKQVRDLLYVDDLCHAYDKAIMNKRSVSGEAFNLGGGPSHTLSLIELLEQLEKSSGRKISYKKEHWRPGDQKIFVSCNNKAANLLDWKPSVDVASGVDKIFAWTSDNLELFQKLN